MPGYKGHLAGGAVTFSILLVLMSRICQPTSIAMAEWFGLCLAGSLFPDIDIKSKGQKYFYWFIFFILLFLAHKKRFDILVLVSLISIVPMLVKHRGLFHRTWFIIGMPLSMWYIISCQFPAYHTQLFCDVIFFIAGALSHLWLDMGIKRMLRF